LLEGALVCLDEWLERGIAFGYTADMEFRVTVTKA